MRDRDAVRSALKGIDAVYHLATRVGAGQSMSEIEAYTSVNNVGTAAVLLRALVENPVERLIVASSLCIYGGRYRAADGGLYTAAERCLASLRPGAWEVWGTEGNCSRRSRRRNRNRLRSIPYTCFPRTTGSRCA